MELNAKRFWERLGSLINHWQKHKTSWAATGKSSPVDSLLLPFGDEDDVLYSRMKAIGCYLFDVEIWQAILLITKDTLHVLTSEKKAKLLQEKLKSQDGKLKLSVLVRDKAHRKDEANFKAMIKAMRMSQDGKRVGVIVKEQAKQKGDLVQPFIKEVQKGGLILEDVSNAWATFLAVKDNYAISCCKKAAELTSQVLRKFLRPQIEDIVDKERKASHTELADKTEDAITNPAKLQMKAKEGEYDSAFTPIIMSGGRYDLKPSAVSDDKPLHTGDGPIICALGARFHNYCSNIARTYLINPTPFHREVYDILTQVYQNCKSALKPDQKLKTVMEAAVATINKSKKSEILPFFTLNCGFGMGLEFREQNYLLDAKNNAVFKEGMVFNFCIGFGDLPFDGKFPEKEKIEEFKKDSEAKKFAVLLADTIVVKDEPEILTNVKRIWNDVAYEMKGEGEEDDQPEDDKDEQPVTASDLLNAPRKTRTQDRKQEAVAEPQSSKQRQQNQKQLEKQRQEEALVRIGRENKDRGEESGAGEGKFRVYSSAAEIPPKKQDQIYVDVQNEAILCPIGDQLVPFHASTIKSVHKTEEGTTTYLRINFLTPDTLNDKDKMNQKIPFAPQHLMFLRELTYRTKSKSLSEAHAAITDLCKKVDAKMKEKKQKDSIVVQDDLVIKKGDAPKLKQISVQPHITRRKTAGGILTAHENGFRYKAGQHEMIDVIYKNIKHAFFQPAEKSVNVLLHFELKNPILLGGKKSKKTKFVQFFVAVMDASQDLDSKKRNNDEDGILEEEEERKNKSRWNEKFHQFVKKVEDQLAASPSQPRIEFDIPYRELMFSGVPHREVTEIMPTVHSLVALEDSPPFVLSLDDVEIANFERVQFRLRNFDLTFVFKDFKKPVVRIDSVPMEKLESIKEWLNKCNILYYESAHNLLWKNIMKTIRADPEGFYKEGGWKVFLKKDDGSDEEEGGEDGEGGGEGGGGKGGGKGGDDSESEFEPDDSDDDEEYESDGDGSGTGSGSDIPEEELSDEGDDWETHAKKAREDDRKKAKEEAEAEGATKRKKPKGK